MKTNILLDAIETVLPGISNKGLIEGADTIIINNGEFIAYNDKISISTLVNDPGFDIEAAINATDFKNIIKGIKEEEVELSINKNILSIISDKTEAQIPVGENSKLILDLIKSLHIMDLEFNNLPDDFNEGLKLTMFNVSDDYSDQNNLFCLCIKDDTIYTADNFRLSRYKMKSSINTTCLIPKNNLMDLYDFNPIGFQKSKGWMHFLNNKDAIFSCRIVEGDYPVTDDLFKIKGSSKKIELPIELKETLLSITSLQNQILNAQKAVKIKFEGTQMFCEIARDKIWVKKTLTLKEKTPFIKPISFKISSIFLIEILNILQTVKVNKTQAVFEIDNKFKHTILLQLEE